MTEEAFNRFRYAFWLTASAFSALLACYYLFLFFHQFGGSAEHAVADGKRVIIDLASGEITLRPAPGQDPSAPVMGPPPASAPEAEAPPETTVPGESAAAKAQEPEPLSLTENGFEPPPLPAIQPKVFTHKVAMLITDAGLKASALQQIAELPGNVTVALSPYPKEALASMAQLKERGHTVALSLPVATLSYPYDDAGPLALLPDAPKEQNLYRLQQLLNQVDTRYVVLPHREGLSINGQTMISVLDYLHSNKKTLIFDETEQNRLIRTQAKSIGLPHIASFTLLDEALTREQLYQRMIQVRETINRNEGDLLIVARPYPLSLTLVSDFIVEFQKAGYQLSAPDALLGVN